MLRSSLRTPRRLLGAAAAALLLSGAPLGAQGGRVAGDVNNDGAVTATDAQMVLTAVIELPLPAGADKNFGDADCDGAVTALDAQIILSKAAQLDVSRFCVGKVYEAPVRTVAVDAGTGKVLVGGTLQLTATAFDDKNVAVSGKPVSWSSSDTTKATVGATGIVTGRAVGSATITATIDGKNGIALVEVLAASSAQTLDLSPASATVLKGSTVTLTAAVRDAAGNPVSGKTFTFSSLDAAIATVNATGVVTGVELGTARIVAQSGTLADTSTVSVVAVAAKANRRWVGGDAAGPTLWGVAGNWRDANDQPGLPATTDTLFIPQTANQPVLKQSFATVAGLVLATGAKLDIEGNELQVTGRIDNDGLIVATTAGKVTVQGVNQGTSYIRGALPSLDINGRTVLVGPVAMTGGLRVIPGALLDLNGYTMRATGALSMEGALLMRARAETLSVRGDAEFFTDKATLTQLVDGVLAVGGNLTIRTPLASNPSPFPAKDRHRTVLDGAAVQKVTVVTLPFAEFQELEIRNTGGVRFLATPTQFFRVKGSATVLSATTLSDSGRVNVLGNFVSAQGSAVTLRNLAVRGGLAAGSSFKPDTLTLLGTDQQIPATSAYEYQTVVAAGTSRWLGNTSLAGSLIVGCVTGNSDCSGIGSRTNLNGQKVTVAKDLRQTALEPTAKLDMASATSELVVGGGVLAPVNQEAGKNGAPAYPRYNVDGEWTRGTLRVAGDFLVGGAGVPATSQTVTVDHLVDLNGSARQTLRAESQFHFDNLTISNSRTADTAVVVNDVVQPAAPAPALPRQFAPQVRRAFNLSTAATVAGTGRLNVAGDFNTATGSKVQLSAVAVGSVLRAATAAGSFTPDTTEFTSQTIVQTIQNLNGYRNVLVSGKTAFGGSNTLEGSLIVKRGGEANLNGRQVTVTKNLDVDGILRMQKDADTLIVKGDALFKYTGDQNAEAYVIAGLLRLEGAASGSQPGGFYPTTTHRTVVTSTSPIKAVSGHFGAVDIVTPETQGSYTQLRNLVARGAFSTVQANTKVMFDSLVVGTATITGPDTVRQSGRGFASTGSVTVRHLELTGRATIGGDLTIVDGGLLTGSPVHAGRYVEQGVVRNQNELFPALKGVRSLAVVEGPASGGTINVGVPISPTYKVELRDSLGALVRGTALVYASTTPFDSSLSGTVRLITTDGVGTFTNLAFTKPTASRTLTLTAYRDNGGTASVVRPNWKVVGPPAQLQPLNSSIFLARAAGLPLRDQASQAPRYAITDAGGNRVKFTGTITVGVDSGAGGLTGTTSVNVADADSVVFDNLVLTKAGTTRLKFDGVGSTAIKSQNFAVTAAAPTRLSIRTQPGVGVANGSNFSPVPVVEMFDQYDNPNTTAQILVTFNKISQAGAPAPDPVFDQQGQQKASGIDAVTWTLFRASWSGGYSGTKPSWRYTVTFRAGTGQATSAEFPITLP